MRWSLLALFALASACNGALTECGDESDISGAWTFAATLLGLDGGVPTTPSTFTIDAQLVQAGSTNFTGIAHYVHGTLTASDPTVFGTLAIPMLTHNDGPKTGVIRGCTIQLNVPIDMPVTDDNNDDSGPVRLRLSGNVTAKGAMTSDETSAEPSAVVFVSDASNTPRPFAWTATEK